MKTQTVSVPHHQAIASFLRAVAVLVVVIGTGLPTAAAVAPAFKREAPLLLAQQDDIGPAAAAAAASAASGGRVLDVRRHSSASGTIYRVKVLLPGGRVRNVSVDGQTGRVRG